MSWETRALVEINFYKKTYNSLYEVEADLNDNKDSLKMLKERIQSLVMITEPKKFCEDGDDPVWWLEQQVKQALEEYEDTYDEILKLEYLVGSWDKMHDPETHKALPLPKDKEGKEIMMDDLQRIDGDFIHVLGRGDSPMFS